MIKVLLFDLGSTLLYSPSPWPPFFERADHAMLDVLVENGIELERSEFLREIQAHLDDYYAQRENDHIERTWMVSLREFLAARGYTNVPGPILRAALDALFAVTQQNWVVEEDAIPTLQILKSKGFRLGMVSNAADDKNVQQLVDHWGLRPYFEFIITSAACGFRKPRPEIFQLALDYFQVPPHLVAMIGDTLEADVMGANNLGIYSIWVTRRARKGGSDHIPSSAVERLDEIPGLLSKVNRG
jgi:HAD superfamily hydrolase (TIGR01662 family)